MKQATRDEYERAKRLALAGIEAHKERAKLREPPTADALVKAIQEKAERGEPATEKELAALHAALAAANPPKRGRGRPKGSKDFAAKRAFLSACIATDDCEFTTYRNNVTGQKMTLCDALAEAMNEAGYTSLTTYDAAAKEMQVIRKSVKRAAETMRALSENMRALSENLQQAFAPLEHLGENLAATLAPAINRMQASQEHLSERLAPVTARMRAAVTIKLWPETKEAIKRHKKTKR